MSVVPLVLEGSERKLVMTQEDSHAQGGVEGDVVFVENLDEKQVTDSRSGNASFGLGVGNEYRDHSDEAKTSLDANDIFFLRPGKPLLSRPRNAHFPKCRFGDIGPRVSLLQKGSSNTSSKIDPRYRGSLLVTVFNLGQKRVKLMRGKKLFTLCSIDAP